VCYIVYYVSIFCSGSLKLSNILKPLICLKLYIIPINSFAPFQNSIIGSDSSTALYV
jgi:hypothetical protein